MDFCLKLNDCPTTNANGTDASTMMQEMILKLQFEKSALSQELDKVNGQLKLTKVSLRVEKMSHELLKTELNVVKTAHVWAQYKEGRKVAVAKSARKSDDSTSTPSVCSSTQTESQDVSKDLDIVLKENVQLKQALCEAQAFVAEEEAGRLKAEAQVQQLKFQLALMAAEKAFDKSNGWQEGKEKVAGPSAGSVCSSCKSGLSACPSSASLSSSLDGPTLDSCSSSSSSPAVSRRSSCSSLAPTKVAAGLVGKTAGAAAAGAAAARAVARAGVASRIPAAPGVAQAAGGSTVGKATMAAKASLSGSKPSAGSKTPAKSAAAAKLAVTPTASKANQATASRKRSAPTPASGAQLLARRPCARLCR